jgi:hypothetical protein
MLLLAGILLSSLIDQESRMWKWQLIREVFLPADVDYFRKIPLGSAAKET